MAKTTEEIQTGMKTIQDWVDEVKSASTIEVLAEIKKDWMMHGDEYPEMEWIDFWRAFTNKELELGGTCPFDEPF